MMLAIASLQTYAQSNTINSFFDAVPESDDVFKLELSGFFLKLATSETEDGDIAKGIKSVRIIGSDQHSLLPTSAVKKLSNGLRRESFEPLAEIRDGKDRVEFLIKENKDVITDFVAKIVDNEGGFLLIAIEGAFSFDDIQGLDLDFEGSEYLKKVPEEKKYPRT